MLLLEKDLRRALKNGDLAFSGQIRKDSLLLTLGEYAQLLSRTAKTINPYNAQSLAELYDPVISNWNQIELQPRKFILVASTEYLRLNNSHYGMIATLSHVARIGLMAHAASYFIDRGYEGHITLEICNLSDHTIVIHQGMPFAKVLVFKCDNSIGEAERHTSKFEFHYGKPNELRSRFCDEFSEPLQERGEKQ